MMLYVSADGDDRNAGTLEQPMRQPEAARRKLRAGDMLRLQRGGIYQPFALACECIVDVYGTGFGHAIIEAGQSATGLRIRTTGAVRIYGLEIIAPKGSGAAGVSFVEPLPPNISLAQCRITGFKDNLNLVQTSDRGTRPGKVVLNGCCVADSTSMVGGNSQGIHADFSGVLAIRECVIDHNGHVPADSVRNHNIYAQPRCRVEISSSIVSNPESHGMQARGGCHAHRVLFFHCPLPISVSRRASVVSECGILDACDIGAQDRAMAIEVHPVLESPAAETRGIEILGNVMACSDPGQRCMVLIKHSDYGGRFEVLVRANVGHQAGPLAVLHRATLGHASLAGARIVIESNDNDEAHAVPGLPPPPEGGENQVLVRLVDPAAIEAIRVLTRRAIAHARTRGASSGETFPRGCWPDLLIASLRSAIRQAPSKGDRLQTEIVEA